MERTGISWIWKKVKKDQLLIVLLAGILLLVIAIPHNEDDTKETSVQAQLPQPGERADIESQLEHRLQQVLEQVQGVGRVQVMITMKSSGKKTLEKDRTVSEEREGSEDGGTVTKRTEETTIFSRDSQGNETPFVAEETSPQVQGVLVAAQGGDNLTVAESISEAVMVLFGVEAHKIKIMKLN